MDFNDPRTTVAIDDLLRRRISRRQALQGAAAAGLSTVALGGLAVQEVAPRMPRHSSSPPARTRSRSIPRSPSTASRRSSGAPSTRTLLNYEGDTLDIVPHLAESYEISDDGLTYTFKIRPGITFTTASRSMRPR